MADRKSSPPCAAAPIHSGDPAITAIDGGDVA
jgi:hypothetical protein